METMSAAARRLRAMTAQAAMAAGCLIDMSVPLAPSTMDQGRGKPPSAGDPGLLLGPYAQIGGMPGNRVEILTVKLGALGSALAADDQDAAQAQEGEGARGGDGGAHGRPLFEAIVGGEVISEGGVEVDVGGRCGVAEEWGGDHHAQVAGARAVSESGVEADPVVLVGVEVVAERAEGAEVGGVLAGNGRGVDFDRFEREVVVVAALDLVDVEEELEVEDIVDGARSDLGDLKVVGPGAGLLVEGGVAVGGVVPLLGAVVLEPNERVKHAGAGRAEVGVLEDRAVDREAVVRGEVDEGGVGAGGRGESGGGGDDGEVLGHWLPLFGVAGAGPACRKHATGIGPGPRLRPRARSKERRVGEEGRSRWA